MKITRKSIVPQVAIAALLLASLACQALGGATPTPGFSALQTMVAATLQAGPVQPSPLPTFAVSTAIPTSTALTVSTPVVFPTTTIPAPALPAATRIQFSTGATQSVTTGVVPAGQVITYVVQALQSQAMLVSVSSPSQQVTLAIFGANGVVLLPSSQGTSSWQGTLPVTQDYYFQVIGVPSAESFTLNVVIAARVQFSPGAIKTTLKGVTIGGYGVTYVAYAQQGQKMDVNLNVPGDSAALTIWGFSDGQPYARAQNGVQDFSLKLPSTQDYIIEVVPQAGQVVEYSLLVRIK
jgi:hypothetical protein